MTSKEQNLTAPSSQLESFMASVRRENSGVYEGNYYGRDKGIGAYGITEGNWRAYAAAAGLPNANWRDPRAQDAVARAKMQRDFDKYGNWQLVAVSWYAGTQAADAVHQGGKVDDNNIRRVLGDDAANYVTEVVRNGSEVGESEWGGASGNSNLMADTGMATPGTGKTQHSETRPQEMVRQRLQALAGMNGTPSSDARAPVTEESAPVGTPTVAEATTLPTTPEVGV